MKLGCSCLHHAGLLPCGSLRQCRNSQNCKTTAHGVHNDSSKDAVYMQVETFGRGQTPTDRAGQPAELAPPFVFLANTAGVRMLWVLLVL